MPYLRGVVVTNHGTESEGVVMAMEAFSWHEKPEDAVACTDELCKGCHVAYEMDIMTFNFESRRVYPTLYEERYREKPSSKTGSGIIPPEDLPKFKADFGLYYPS